MSKTCRQGPHQRVANFVGDFEAVAFEGFKLRHGPRFGRTRVTLRARLRNPGGDEAGDDQAPVHSMMDSKTAALNF